MNQYIIAYDLGTGGCKASLYDVKGNCVADSFISCDTHYPQQGWHEQKPEDWWNAVVQSTKNLLENSPIESKQVSAIGISGHSLGLVPVDKSGQLLREYVPIWSDSRPTEKELKPFFEKISEEEWYNITGNGFPPALYTVFKLKWLQNNEPATFSKIDKILGTKDYINFKLTGVLATDYSYASGTGVYDLKAWDYSDKLIEASELPTSIFPDLVASTEVLGTLTSKAATELGLEKHVQVVAGGVDNSCMALGARCFQDGRTYNSLGSSSWIAVSSEQPLLNVKTRPYVFTHVVPGLFTSATAIFSAGSSFRWLRDNMCQQLKEKAGETWEQMTVLAEEAPTGSNQLLFNPSLAGGTMIDNSPNIRGAFVGIDLSHTPNDIIKSVMEGIAMGLRIALDELRNLTEISSEITVVGGGSKSSLWRQIYADIYNTTIVKTNIDEQAAALGAAALAAVGTGIWNDFSIIDQIHKTEAIESPVKENNETYERLLPVYRKLGNHLAEIGDMLNTINNNQ